MRMLFISGLAVTAAAWAMPAAAASESAGAGASLSVMGRSFSGHGMHKGGARSFHRWGPRMQGRWWGGHRAPGGWASYRRPVRGYVLPRYWVQRGFYIGNYGSYGLPAPGYGYGWSRYYDDAVLTDRYGRVYDSRPDLAWDRYEGGYADADAPPPPGVRAPYDHRVFEDEGVTYSRRWVGTWYGADGRVYSGEYRGSYKGTADGGYEWVEDRGAPPPPAHWEHGAEVPAGPAPTLPYVYPSGGYISGGYYYPAPVVTTVTVQPATVTTYVEETVTYSKPKKPWRPAARSKIVKAKRCACK